MRAIDARAIEAWRSCLTHEPQPKLGQFNWPMVLEASLDEIEQLRRVVQAVESQRDALADAIRAFIAVNDETAPMDGKVNVEMSYGDANRLTLAEYALEAALAAALAEGSGESAIKSDGRCPVCHMRTGCVHSDRLLAAIDALPDEPQARCPQGRTDYEACYAPFRYCPVNGCNRPGPADDERPPTRVGQPCKECGKYPPWHDRHPDLHAYVAAAPPTEPPADDPKGQR